MRTNHHFLSMIKRLSAVGLIYVLLACLTISAQVGAQEPTITPNYKDADIRQVIEAVGEITGKNFV